MNSKQRFVAHIGWYVLLVNVIEFDELNVPSSGK